MRWKIGFEVVVLATAAVVAWGQTNGTGGQVSAEDRREAEQFAAGMRSCREAMQTLKGHRLVVRVYPNISVDPEKYVKASVPFDASGVQLSAIKAVCPLVTQYAQIIFQTADQTDPAVARAFDDAVFLILYRDAPWQPQWVHGDGQTLEPYWTFLDAQGKPMSGALVQIGMMPSNRAISDHAGIHVRQATLDEKGRLKRIVSGGGEFVFIVQHPSYGTASVARELGIAPSSGLYVLPLVPKGTSAATQAVQGTVVDGDGRPVAGAWVYCALSSPSSAQPAREAGPARMRFFSEAVTDENGTFAFCQPIVSDDLKSISPAPAESRYGLCIEPPQVLHLRQLGWPVPISA